MKGSLSERIRELRCRFESEASKLKAEYKAEVDRLKKKRTATEKFDYSRDYKETYEASYGSLYKIYSDFAALQDRTLGIDFRMSKYIRTLKPGAIPKGAVESFFASLVERCQGAIAKLSSSRSIADDVAPSKALCQGVVDLEYIVANADRLLAESGIPEAKRREDLKEIDMQLAACDEVYRKMSSVENMKCYPEIKAMTEECRRLAADALGMYLGAKEPQFSGDYHFLIGFTRTEIAPEDLAFAKARLSAEEKIFANTPIFFDLKGGHSSLIIRGDKKFFSSEKYREFIRNLYFVFAGALPSGCLKYLGVDLKQTEVPSGRVAARIKNALGPEYLFTEAASDLRGFARALEPLNAEWRANAAAYGDSFSGIFEYNKANPNAKQPFVMVNVVGYPAEFCEGGEESREELITLASSCGDKGVITVISELTDGEFNEIAPRLSPEELNADVIEFTKSGTKYNGQNATLDITATGFSSDRYWDMLKNYYSAKTSITLKDTIKQLELDRAEGFRKRTEPYDKFSIPIGAYEDSKGFDMQMSFRRDQGFGIVLGGTTSGKSSFLHSFILSTASQYAPDEIEFYLADFKRGGEEAPTFSNYKANSVAENLYIPHVRYILLKSSPENTVELLNKILRMVDERNHIIKHSVVENGVARTFDSVAEYNASDAVRRGDAKKLPFVMFVIDEFNNMLTGGADDDNADSRSKNRVLNDIKTKLENILKQVRFAGIGILLAGQDTKGLSDEHLGQVGTRICFSINEPEILSKIFKIRHSDAIDMMSKFKIGCGYYTNMGKKEEPKFVRTAYAGDTSSEAALSFAREIRAKYPEFSHYAKTQVAAGMESFVDYDNTKFLEAESLRREREFGTAKKKNRYVHEHKLLMGTGSAGALPVYLDYSTSSKAKNYFAVCDEEKQIILSRSVMFSYLDLAKREGFRPSLHFFPQKEIRNECLGDYLDACPELENAVNIIRKKPDLAKKIMELYALLNERERMVEDDEEDSFDPVLLIIGEIAWLNDKKKLNWLPDFGTGAPRAAAQAPARPAREERRSRRERSSDFDSLFDEAMNESAEDIMDGELSEKMEERRRERAAGREARAERRAMRDSGERTVERAAESQPKAAPSAERFTDSDVREAIANLFTDGNKYSIYLFIMSNSVKEIEKLFPTVKSPYNYCVFDSFAALSGAPTENAPLGIAYVMPDATKTRLIDWRPEDMAKIL